MKHDLNAIYENGVLRPLEPLDLAEHAQVHVTVSSQGDEDWRDHDALDWAQREGDPTISLVDVRARLSRIKGSLAESIIAERGDY